MKTISPQKFIIPKNVDDLLSPISKGSPTGIEASTDEEYFKLEMEIGKSVPDYKVCIDLATEILQRKSKDLRVASWLCFSWYRNEKLDGMKNGLILLVELIKKYKDGLYPTDSARKSRALQFLNTYRFVKLFEREVISNEIASTILDIDLILQQLLDESVAHLPDNVPEFKELKKVISSHTETAQKFVEKTPNVAQTKEKKEEDTKPSVSVNEKAKIKELEEVEIKKEQDKTPLPESAVNISDNKISSESEAGVTIKKALKYFIQQDEEDESKYMAYLYGVSRSLIWGKLTLPPNQDSVTLLSAPDSSVQSTIKSWFNNQDWSKIVPAVEMNILNEDSTFRYWWTAQRYLVIALEGIGGSALKAAEEVKFQLEKLISRFPDLINLKFSNNLPFADDDTSKWFEEEVKSSYAGEKGDDMILPPILGEDYNPIDKEYQDMCGELPEKFEQNMEKMQKGIEEDNRRKGKFLRLLNLANFCIQAKVFNLAKVHLSSLQEKIEEYQLAEWEPALCVSVFESVYLVNLKLLEKEKDTEQIAFLEKQQHDLFSKIGNYDGVLALRLASRNKKKGA